MAKCLDLHILPRVDDSQSCDLLAGLLSAVRYSAVGLTLPTGLFRERVKLLQDVFHQHGLESFLRVDLSPSSRTELLRALRKFRNSYDIVAVNCLNQRTATVACRDRRVDIVFFNLANRNLRFTHSFARLLHGAIEFNLISDLVEQPEISVFSRMRKAIDIAQEHGVSVVLSSGARNYQMVRSPSQIMALAMTFGLSGECSSRGVTSVPLAIVSENRMKRGPEYIEDGVKIVIRRGR